MPSLALFVLLAQQSAKPLVVPALTGREFQAQVSAAVAHLNAGEWEAARLLTARMPSLDLTFSYDDADVPTDLRPAYRQAFDDGARQWQAALPSLKLTQGANPALRFILKPSLAKDPDTGATLGIALFWGQEPSEPRLEAVVGFRRGVPEQTVTAQQVTQEALFSIGAALGLSPTMRFGTAMARSDTLSWTNSRVDRNDAGLATRCLALSDALRAAAESRKPVELAVPKLVMGSNQFRGGEVEEGKPHFFSVPVSNTGDGDLQLNVMPDCSCFTIDAPEVVRPGQTAVVQVRSTTEGFVGPQAKSLYFYSNDPEEPVRTFRYETTVLPRYRVVDPQQGRPLPYRAEGVKASFFVYSPTGRPLTFESTSVAGTTGAVEVKPWKGEIKDPAMGSTLPVREVARVDVLLSTATVQGRLPVTVSLVPTDKGARVVFHQLVIQKGIVAEPPQVYFGQVRRQARTMACVLVAPEGEFKVKGITTSDPVLTVRHEPAGPGRVRLTIILGGDVDFGEFRGEVRVKTDSKAHPLVVVPVRAEVQ